MSLPSRDSPASNFIKFPSPFFTLKFHSTTLIPNGLLCFYHHDHLRYQAISTIAFSGSGARDITGIAHAHVGLEGTPGTAYLVVSVICLSAKVCP